MDEIMNHELYRRNQKALKEVTEAQIIKGYEKYGEPLISSEWGGKQLIRHAREELVDLGHYIAALEEKIEELERSERMVETNYEHALKKISLLEDKVDFMSNVAKRLQSENDLLKDKLQYIEKYQKVTKK